MFHAPKRAGMPTCMLAIFALCTLPAVLFAQAAFPFEDSSLPIAKRVDDLVGRMTLNEKISQMMDQAPAIPRLHVPQYGWWNEGLHGMARSGYATMFPQAIGMAATWDTKLIGEEGGVIGTEARAKYNQAIAENNHERYYGLTIWSPNINIFRDPRWGRGQETYGEDPYLTSRLGVAFVNGLQGNNPQYFKVIATPKHFAVHSGPESERHRFDVTPSAYDLEDTYLPAFRAAITEAYADSIMCAYNRVDGTPACANTMLLDETLRRRWGFKGFVTSDCGAVDDFYMFHKTSPDAEHAAASAVLAGTDTNCGNTYKALGQAVKDHLLPESAIDTAVARLFTARMQLGMFDGPTANPYNQIPMSEDGSPAHQALALTAARESMVLLKNEHQTLPLKPGVHTLAVIGPNAASLAAIEGNYNAIPLHPVLPVDGIEAEFAGARVLYAQGSSYAEGIALPVPRTALHPTAGASEQGLKGEYYASSDFSGRPAATRIDKQVDFDWNYASPLAGLLQQSFSVRWTGTLTPPSAGDYRLAIKLGGCDSCSVADQLTTYLDDKLVDLRIPNSEPASGKRLPPGITMHFADTAAHTLRIEFRHPSGQPDAGISLRWEPPVDSLRDEAVQAAKQADVVVAFVGLSSELEGEEMPIHVEGFAGGDRTSIDLPAAQLQLLQAVAATGRPLVVVLMNGSALAVNWAQQHAAAILDAWYPGQAGGTAIAETLSGKNNPGGKLPITFYTGLDQLPPFTDYSMKNRTYRYFSGKPLYGFGFGLSYTSFAFSGLKLSAGQLEAGQPLTVEADVRNTGIVEGDQVAELYLTPPRTAISPRLALTAFERVHLRPGESQHLTFVLRARQLSTVNEAGRRAVAAGTYMLTLGGAQPEETEHVTAKFTISGNRDLAR